MFRRFLKGNDDTTGDPRKGKKRRVSPTSGVTTPGVTTTGSLDSSAAAPGFLYALNEYAQTVAPASSQDDGQRNHAWRYNGREDPDGYMEISESQDEAAAVRRTMPGIAAAAAAATTASSSSRDSPTFGLSATHSSMGSRGGGPGVVLQDIIEGNEDSSASTGSKTEPSRSYPAPVPFPSKAASSSYRARKAFPPTHSSHPFPDAVYEEWYGDAYLGGPIKYIYPSGYQSMRPRGGPWKLSIVVCLLFTWLSVFIIGHCSDRADQSYYYEDYNYNAYANNNANNAEETIDDDKLVIERRWCGSRLLYMMWVVSMLITGLAAAYCSVIGYIKVRDFAVANTRSQTPDLVGKSDYYVQLMHDSHPPPHHHTEQEQQDYQYQRTIYQSDGNPQFWGGHIYRPTQAAVAITSR